MSSAWVAASVRARALAHRRLGAAGVRELARCGSVELAVAMLQDSSYDRGLADWGRDGRHRSAGDEGLAAAQHAVAGSVLWHLRVLGGWVPRGGTAGLRALAGPFEVANVEEHLRRLKGQSTEPAFVLSSFASAWPRVAVTTSVASVQDVLNASVWGSVGTGERSIRLCVRLRAAARIARQVPAARAWAAGAAALVAAREQCVAGRPLPPSAAEAAAPLLGRDAIDVQDVDALRAALPAEAAWALGQGGRDWAPWLAEARWWARVERDGFALLRGSTFTSDATLGALAVLAVDAWRVRAALEVAARGAPPAALEQLDAVA